MHWSFKKDLNLHAVYILPCYLFQLKTARKVESSIKPYNLFFKVLIRNLVRFLLTLEQTLNINIKSSSQSQQQRCTLKKDYYE